MRAAGGERGWTRRLRIHGLLVGLGVFVLGAVVLVVAWHPLVFIAARAGQGAGAALLLSNGSAILAGTYSGPALRRAMGLYLAGFAVAQAFGPVVGSVLAATVGWRAMFAVTVVVGVTSLLAGRRLLRRRAGRPTPARASARDRRRRSWVVGILRSRRSRSPSSSTASCSASPVLRR